MDEENKFDFKDEEINKLTADLAKANKREFGDAFKSASIEIEKNDSPEDEFEAATKTVTEKVVQNQIPPQTTSTAIPTGSTPPETEAEKAKKELYTIAKPLRTYERDVAEAIRQKNESVASINLAAQKKEEKTGIKREMKTSAPQATGRGLILLISSVLILAGVSFAGWVIYYFINKPAPVVVVTAPRSIITTDTQITLNTSNLNQENIQNEIKNVFNTQTEKNKLVGILINDSVSGEEKEISTEKFINLFAATAPTSLSRALGPQFVFGFQNIQTNEPFIFTRVSSFDNAFDGMLRWEKGMKKDTEKIFPVGTNPLGPTNTIQENFQDMVIKNKDTRVLKDSFGNIVLMYSFLDRENLVITTNEQTFVEILNRFFASKTVR